MEPRTWIPCGHLPRWSGYVRAVNEIFWDTDVGSWKLKMESWKLILHFALCTLHFLKLSTLLGTHQICFAFCTLHFAFSSFRSFAPLKDDTFGVGRNLNRCANPSYCHSERSEESSNFPLSSWSFAPLEDDTFGVGRSLAFAPLSTSFWAQWRIF